MKVSGLTSSCAIIARSLVISDFVILRSSGWIVGLYKMARPVGFEPTTCGVETRCSNPTELRARMLLGSSALMDVDCCLITL
jgi:hypothetical protein